MAIHLSSQTQDDDSDPDTDQIQRRNRQNETQTGQCLSLPDQTGFQLKAIGFVVQKALFDIKP